MTNILLWLNLTLLLLLGITITILILRHQKSRELLLELNGQITSFSLQMTNILPQIDKHLREQSESLQTATSNLSEKLTKQLHESHVESLQYIQTNMQQGLNHLQQQISNTLKQNADANRDEINKLTKTTEMQLQNISGQVEKRLSEGFEKTNATFTNIMQRLSLIDQAQKKITELSTNVVSLQNILSDKQARGAFGEVQLSALLHNVMPDNSFALQHTLSNGKRADCILFMPQPTGNVVIDAKFPLENFRRLTKVSANDSQRSTIETQFRQDIKKHIQDIASKYIVEQETSCGAVMFIPAEAIFAEIHSNFPGIVEYAQRMNVWLASPTTMMAVLTTARAVLKDAATREQIHVIQEHLGYLAKDFSRFQTRMDDLARHIRQANDDVNKVSTSAKKIANRFQQIESVDIGNAQLDESGDDRLPGN